MKQRSVTEILLSVALMGGAAYFLFNTEKGREWLERLKNVAADQLDGLLAELEQFLLSMEEKGLDKKPIVIDVKEAAAD